ncbi:uncharacterized protein LOC144869290 isoform X1 [Branchiostoma floridae x Branchiostoma japonicum]
MMNSLGAGGGTGDPQESFVPDTSVATGMGRPGALFELPGGTAKNTLDDLDDIFKEVDEILEKDKAKSGEASDDTNARETTKDWQPERKGPLKSTMKEGCCEKDVELHYRSSQEGNGMLSAQPALQGTVHHLPLELVGPGGAHAQNHPHPGFPLNHQANFNFGPVYNMAGLGNFGHQSRGTGAGDPAHEKKNELRLELEKVLSRPSNTAGSWYKFDVLRTELQILEAPLCGLVTQPAEDQ